MHTEADTSTPFVFQPDLRGLQRDAAVTRPIYFVWEELFLKRILLLILIQMGSVVLVFLLLLVFIFSNRD